MARLTDLSVSGEGLSFCQRGQVSETRVASLFDASFSQFATESWTYFEGKHSARNRPMHSSFFGTVAGWVSVKRARSGALSFFKPWRSKTVWMAGHVPFAGIARLE
jgi:hypothetical protein